MVTGAYTRCEVAGSIRPKLQALLGFECAFVRLSSHCMLSPMTCRSFLHTIQLFIHITLSIICHSLENRETKVEKHPGVVEYTMVL